MSGRKSGKHLYLICQLEYAWLIKSSLSEKRMSPEDGFPAFVQIAVILCGCVCENMHKFNQIQNNELFLGVVFSLIAYNLGEMM